MNKEEIAEGFEGLQNEICAGLEQSDGKAIFREDQWERKEGGGGKTRIVSEGNIIEKGGVNFSKVYGPTPDKILKALGLEPADFFATGVSSVIHPINPWMPIIHMNVRYFKMSNGQEWFGGGIDLTPHYVVKEDARYFHTQVKKCCDNHDPHFYPKFKKWADDYFFIEHRHETRGIGGIFFDRLSPGQNLNRKQLNNFVCEVALTLPTIYSHFMEHYGKEPYGEDEKKWQLLRRGRYVEFNLIYDKGTKFGLDTGGRTESILMSLPPDAKWIYNYVSPGNSKEQQTINLLKKGIDWVSQ